MFNLNLANGETNAARITGDEDPLDFVPIVKSGRRIRFEKQFGHHA